MKAILILMLMTLSLTTQAEQLCFRGPGVFLTVQKYPATMEPIESVALAGALSARHGHTVQPVIGSGVRRGDFWLFDIDWVPNMKLDLGFNPVYPPNWMRDVTCTLPQ